jgi:hypothetical protein
LKLGLAVCGEEKCVAASGRVRRKKEIMELAVGVFLY